MPIVTGERRKAKKKQADGRRTYRKKANAVRLCADDLLTRERLVAYHDSYAAAMAKYGLQRGIRGSEARHTTTAQYYRDLKRQAGELKANVQRLQAEQRQAERQLMELQAKHRRELSDKEAEHQKEVSFLKSIIQKAKKWFPLFQELVYMEKFCLKVGFNERQTAVLRGRALFGRAQAEVHDRGIRLPSGERPERQIQTCACHQWATDWRMVQGIVWQAVLIH